MIGLVCHCKGGRIMSFGKVFGLATCPLLFSTLPRSLEGRSSTLLFLSLSSCLLKAVKVIGLVSMCQCKGGRFMSFRKAFGLVALPHLASFFRKAGLGLVLFSS